MSKTGSMLLLLFTLLLGCAIGYYVRNLNVEKRQTKTVVMQEKECKSVEIKKDVDNSGTIKKIDLLKDYINFALLPTEKIGNVDEYVAKMNAKADAIGDAEFSQKYTATGEGNDREQKILDFFNYSIDKIKSELQK